MKLVALETVRVAMPLVSPFRTSFGTEPSRDVLLLHAILADADGNRFSGWAECVSGDDPYYCSEYVAGSVEILRRYLVPAVAAMPHATPESLAPAMARVKGHRMSKAALETAFLDAWLRGHGLSLAEYLGATVDRVPCGVSVGIMDSLPELLAAVSGYLHEGYRRIKLKIEPGWDLEPVAAVRGEFGDILLQVDANTAYHRRDAAHLQRLDEFDLLLIEQPLDEEDILGHAQLVARLNTPICLDESIVSARAAADALQLQACDIVNIKPGRVGGYLESRRIHEVCAASGIPVWCGGMLETGIGRAANLALAAMPGFTLPGDTSASRRYYAQDVTEPFELDEHGCIGVPRGPGIGVVPIPEVLAELATERGWMLGSAES